MNSVIKGFLGLSFVLVSLPAFADMELGLCGEEVRSAEILSVFNEAIQKIERSDNPFQSSIRLISKTVPRICEYEALTGEMYVGTLVTTSGHDEEGNLSGGDSECFMRLVNDSGQWSATYILCEELDVEEEL